MKKLTLLLGVMLMFFASSLKASTADLFTYNEETLTAQMADLNELEKVVKQNEGITLHELNVSNSAVINKINLSSPLDYSKTMFGIENIDWGSFAWGFCCWPVGIFTVLLNDNKDNDAKISYFIGAGVMFVLSVISSASYRVVYL
jgi:hypothetical protein